ncbi:MAG: sulfotransferase family protein [Candidatus Heimdallarchaeota archaeon]
MQESRKVTEQTLVGTRFLNWLKLLFENRFRIGFRFLPRAFFVTFITWIMIPLVLFERIRFSRRIKRTPITNPPIFIIGHWRSGTTYIQTLMIQDKQFSYLSNLQAFLPWVFLGSSKMLSGFISRLLPEKRRMDDVSLSIDGPQEDEYAMANITTNSMYHGINFPRKINYYSRYLAIDELPLKTVMKWKKTYRTLLKKITFASKGKQLVLKNPANTFRVKLLLEMFPDAKFIHIYRNPLDVYPSHLLLHKKMFPYFHLQKPFTMDIRKEFVLNTYTKMFEKFFNEKDLIPNGNLVEIKYEDFIQEPFKTIKDIYLKLNLSGFDSAEDNFNSFIDSQKNFRKNIHELDDDVVKKVSHRWRMTIEKWGYT